MVGRAATDPSPVRVSAMLVLALAAAPSIQIGVATLAPEIVDDLGLNRTQLGSFTSIVFGAAILWAPLGGNWVDRAGPRGPIAAGFAASMLASLVLAFADSYALFACAAVLVGWPTAVGNPSTNRLIQALRPDGSRALLMGLKQSGVKVGQVTASLALPPLALVAGWRVALACLAVVGAIGLAVLGSKGAPHTSVPIVLAPRGGSTFERGLIWRLTAFALMMGVGQSAVMAYLPLFSVEALGMSLATAGAVAGTTAFVGLVSRILWAFPAERIDRSTRLLVLMAAGSVASVLYLTAVEPGQPGPLFAAAVFLGGTSPVWNVVAMLLVIRRTAHHATGRATSVMFSGFALGFVVGPLIFGRIVDLTLDYTNGWYVVVGCFVAATLVALDLSRREGRLLTSDNDPRGHQPAGRTP